RTGPRGGGRPGSSHAVIDPYRIDGRRVHPETPDGAERYREVMGILYYGGSNVPIHIEDRALAHLKVVIIAKLRRNESFTVSWRHHPTEPEGRSTIWLHPSLPLRF